MRISRWLLQGLFCAVVVSGLSARSWAQTNSLFGSSGPLSQTGTTSQRGGLTGSGLGTSSGLRTGGTTGQSANQLGTTIGNTQLGQVSGTIGQGFVGRSDNAGRFVGQQQAGQQTSQSRRNFTGVGTTGRRTTGATNFGGNQFNQTANRFGGTSQQLTIRPIQRVAFRFPQRTAAGIDAALRTRFQQLRLRQPGIQGVSASLGEGGEVVLRGSVDSESTRELAANIVRLEPGVRSVKNELVVRTAGSAP